MYKIIIVAILNIFISINVKSQTTVQEIDTYFSKVNVYKCIEETRVDVINKYERETTGLGFLEKNKNFIEKYKNKVNHIFQNNNAVLIYKLNVFYNKGDTNHIIKIDSMNKNDIIFFKNFKIVAHVEYVENDPYFEIGLTCWEKTHCNSLKKALKKILKLNIKYLMVSENFPGTLLYILNNKIYVYRFIKHETFEIDKYIDMCSSAGAGL